VYDGTFDTEGGLTGVTFDESNPDSQATRVVAGVNFER
jgi:hypothetical protein